MQAQTLNSHNDGKHAPRVFHRCRDARQMSMPRKRVMNTVKALTDIHVNMNINQFFHSAHTSMVTWLAVRAKKGLPALPP